MIHIITQESAHLYGDVMPSMYRLRYRAFILRQAYDVSHIRQMEYDEYDTPATAYLVWRDTDNQVRGCARISPTSRPYMIRKIWPELVTLSELPQGPKVWEASRLCIDKDLPSPIRKMIQSELVYALHEFGLRLDLNSLIGVMQPRIWQRVFINSGWPIEFLGPPRKIHPREEIVAGRMHIAQAISSKLKILMNMPAQIIENFEETLKEAA